MSSHFQPALEVMKALPSIIPSKSTSRPETARPSSLVWSRPFRRYSASSLWLCHLPLCGNLS